MDGVRLGAFDPRVLAGASVAAARSGLVRPYWPGQAARIGYGLLRYGAGPGFGPLAGASCCPGADGIVDDDGAIACGELERRCERVAAGLGVMVEPGGAVAVLARNSASFYLAMVGAARSGLDVVYLNPGFSPEQVAQAVKRFKVRAIVHDAEFAGKPPRDVLRIPAKGPDRLSIEAMAAQQRPRAPLGAAMAGLPGARRSRHVMLTSGTTGEPKSAPRTGGSVASAISLVSRLPNRARERWLIAAPMFHAWGWLNALLAMFYGSTVVVMAKFDPEEVLARVERERCQVLVAVPAMLRRIMSLPPRARARHDTSSLRAVTVSGSPLPPALAEAFMGSFGDILHSLYGSTEAGYAALASPADLRAAPGTAGRPLPLVGVRVLGANGEPCPPGTPGEIWVDSRDTIAASPPAEPSAAGEGIRTGDIGWLDGAGRLFISGRADDLIITGGENVYPSDVETVLERHPAVVEAAVVASPDETYGQVLVAHLAARRPVTARALRAWCGERLAPFQVPRRFVIHDELPHNAAGKVIKRGL